MPVSPNIEFAKVLSAIVTECCGEEDVEARTKLNVIGQLSFRWLVEARRNV